MCISVPSGILLDQMAVKFSKESHVYFWSYQRRQTITNPGVEKHPTLKAVHIFGQASQQLFQNSRRQANYDVCGNVRIYFIRQQHGDLQPLSKKL